MATVVPFPAFAHGGGAPQLSAVPVGPYRVYAWTSPDPWRVGPAHTTVAVTVVTGEGSETPVSGAQVTVHYVPVEPAGAAIVAPAKEGVGASAGFYEADADLPTPGAWQVTIQVAGSAGQGETTFTTQALPANEFNWWLIGVGVLLVLVGVGYLGTRRWGAPTRASSKVRS